MGLTPGASGSHIAIMRIEVVQEWGGQGRKAEFGGEKKLSINDII